MSTEQPTAQIYQLTRPEASYRRPLLRQPDYIGLRNEIWHLGGIARSQARAWSQRNRPELAQQCEQQVKALITWTGTLQSLQYGAINATPAAALSEHNTTMADIRKQLKELRP